jgi:hypothetical protein
MPGTRRFGTGGGAFSSPPNSILLRRYACVAQASARLVIHRNFTRHDQSIAFEICAITTSAISVALACAVIPTDAGIQKADWMSPDQVRHDVGYPELFLPLTFTQYIE